MEGCRSIAFSSPSGIARFARPSSEVPSRASGCGPATRRSKVFSKVSNGESVRTRRRAMGSSFHFGAVSRPWGLPRFSPELTPLAGNGDCPGCEVFAATADRPEAFVQVSAAGYSTRARGVLRGATRPGRRKKFLGEPLRRARALRPSPLPHLWGSPFRAGFGVAGHGVRTGGR
jgi:hypothetical protein